MTCSHLPMDSLFLYYYFKKNLLFLAVLGLRCCVCGLLSSCGKWTLLCCSLLQCMGFSLQWLPCSRAPTLGAYASVVAACRLQSKGSVVVAHGLLVPVWHVEFPWTRAQTSVSCFGRWILIHWTTEGSPCVCIIFLNLISFCEPTIQNKS